MWVPVCPSAQHWASCYHALSCRDWSRLDLSQPVSSTASAELESRPPSGFFLPLQNGFTSPEPCPARLPAEGLVFSGLHNTKIQEELESGAASKLASSSEAQELSELI